MAKKERTENFGPLEGAIMDVLWSGGEQRVRGIHSKLAGRKAAQTSVAVTLDRLFDKGLVKRRTQQGRGGLYYLYSPRTTRDEYQKTVMQGAIDRIVERFGPAAVSYFNERFSKKRAAAKR